MRSNARYEDHESEILAAAAKLQALGGLLANADADSDMRPAGIGAILLDLGDDLLRVANEIGRENSSD